MRILSIQKWNQRCFEVIIRDTWTGDSIIIDSHSMNKMPLSKQQYYELEKVKEIINSEKPLYLFSIQ